MNAPMGDQRGRFLRGLSSPTRLVCVGILFVVPVGLWLWWARTPRPEPPRPDLSDADPQVVEAIEEARQAVLHAPRSASAWGRLGMVLRAHDFGEEANTCFAHAEQLDPNEPRWPYL